MDYGMPRADTLPSFRDRDRRGALADQSARHQGRRRRRHHRGARRRSSARSSTRCATTACATSRCRRRPTTIWRTIRTPRQPGNAGTDVMPGGLTKRQMIGAIGAWAASSGVTHAQPSTKPIQIIVPFAPGASADGAAESSPTNSAHASAAGRSWSKTRPAPAACSACRCWRNQLPTATPSASRRAERCCSIPTCRKTPAPTCCVS